MYGMAKNRTMPVIFNMRPLDGSIFKFVSLDNIRLWPESPPKDYSPPIPRGAEFETFQAFHHDTQDSEDGLSYYYLSFIANKFDNPDTNNE